MSKILNIIESYTSEADIARGLTGVAPIVVTPEPIAPQDLSKVLLKEGTTGIIGTQNFDLTNAFDLFKLDNVSNIITLFNIGSDNMRYSVADGFKFNRLRVDDLIVDGNFEQLHTTDTIISDNVIEINKGDSTGGVSARYAGIQIDRLLGSKGFIYDDNTNTFNTGDFDTRAGRIVSVSGNIITLDNGADNLTSTQMVGKEFKVFKATKIARVLNITAYNPTTKQATVSGNITGLDNTWGWRVLINNDLLRIANIDNSITNDDLVVWDGNKLVDSGISKNDIHITNWDLAYNRIGYCFREDVNDYVQLRVSVSPCDYTISGRYITYTDGNTKYKLRAGYADNAGSLQGHNADYFAQKHGYKANYFNASTLQSYWKEDGVEYRIVLNDGKLYAIKADGSQAVDLKLGVSGDVIFKTDGSIQSRDYESGITGKGFKFSDNSECDNLTIRDLFKVNTFVNNKINITNGDMIVSDSANIAYTHTDSQIYIKTNDLTFSVGDKLRCQTSNKIYYFTITDIVDSSLHTDSKAVRGTKTGSGEIEAGDLLTRWNGGLLYLNSSDDINGAYLDVMSDENIKVRLGNLVGINDAVFGQLNGYGLYGDNVYLKGKMILSSGSSIDFADLRNTGNTFTHIDANGIYTGSLTANQIKANLADLGGWKINAADLTSPNGVVKIRNGAHNGILIQPTSGNWIKMDYASNTDWGIKAIKENNTLFELGYTNKISSWNFDEDYLWSGTKQINNNFTTDGITIGSNAIRSKNFRVDTNGDTFVRGDIEAESIILKKSVIEQTTNVELTSNETEYIMKDTDYNLILIVSNPKFNKIILPQTNTEGKVYQITVKTTSYFTKNPRVYTASANTSITNKNVTNVSIKPNETAKFTYTYDNTGNYAIWSTNSTAVNKFLEWNPTDTDWQAEYDNLNGPQVLRDNPLLEHLHIIFPSSFIINLERGIYLHKPVYAGQRIVVSWLDNNNDSNNNLAVRFCRKDSCSQVSIPNRNYKEFIALPNEDGEDYCYWVETNTRY